MPRHPRCPICRTALDLEHLVTDEAQDALIGHIYRLPAPLRLALVPYLGCWRSDDRDLAPERALRLAGEVRALDPDDAILAAGLSLAVDGLRTKWAAEGRRPLRNHRYLSECLETARRQLAVAGNAVVVSRQPPPTAPAPAPTTSRTLAGAAALERLRHGD